MVVVNMKGVGELIGEGNYPVTLTKVSTKKNAKGNDVITIQATIRGSDTTFEGRPLFRNFTIKNEPDADNSGTLFYLQQAFLAFEADEEDVTSDKFDPEKVGKSLYGNRAEATVSHRVNTEDPEKKYLDVQFRGLGM